VKKFEFELERVIEEEALKCPSDDELDILLVDE